MENNVNQNNSSSWFTDDERDKEYHMGQFKRIYRSTEVFTEKIKPYIQSSSSVCDMACGCGANTAYLAQMFPEISFTGIDFNPNDVKIGSDIIKNDLNLKNVTLKSGDWYHPSQEDINVYDGIVSFQTLSWLPGYKKEIACLAELNPKWIAISSLFFEVQIDFDIKIHEYDRKDADGSRDSYYNIYSLPKVREEFDKLGYHNFEFFKFDIDIDIPQSHPNHMGTYTQKTEDGKRLQISGSLLMPWYFIVASK